MGEVVIGVDAHKRSHTLVAVDEVGRKLGERTVPATGEGHLQALEWASRWPAARFALEDLCVPITSPTSCDQPVFVDHATDVSVSSDAVQVEVDRFG